MKKLEPKDIRRMHSYFRKTMVKELKEGGYRVVSIPDANTMRISLSTKDLKASTTWPNVVVAIAPIVVTVGQVTAKGTLRESLRSSH